MKKFKVLVVFGTRPEAIKMCPVVIELKKRKSIQTVVCVTGQHKEMLKQVLDAFNVIPDYDLDIMKPNQTLFDVTNSILLELKDVINEVSPNITLVHGDTTTAFASALSSFYLGVDIGHVEAGLRTNDIYSPFPEEFNRHAISILAKYNFAPTKKALNNLIKENIRKDSIHVTGNTAIDAMKYTLNKGYSTELTEWIGDSKLILLTVHRRENFGEPMQNIFTAINRIIKDYDNVKVLYPIHLNPKVRDIADKYLEKSYRIKIIEPLQVVDFHNIMSKSYIILTDSGGVQEEAPNLGIPVLVLRDVTERPEGVKAGTLKVVGTSEDSIYEESKILLNSASEYNKMSVASNPYGDGESSAKIVDVLEKEYLL